MIRKFIPCHAAYIAALLKLAWNIPRKPTASMKFPLPYKNSLLVKGFVFIFNCFVLVKILIALVE